MSRVLLLGASSLVGRFLSPRLTEAGHNVDAVGRQPAPDGLPTGVQWHMLDLTTPSEVNRIPECDVVVSLLPPPLLPRLVVQVSLVRLSHCKD